MAGCLNGHPLHSDLLEVDTLSTGIGSGKDLHPSVIQVHANIVGDKGRDTQLLQWVPVGMAIKEAHAAQCKAVLKLTTSYVRIHVADIGRQHTVNLSGCFRISIICVTA